MIRLLRIAALSCLLLGLVACSDEERVTPPFGDDGDGGGGGEDLGSVSGLTVNENGQPLVGVEVAVGDETGFSDSSGRFLVAGLDPAAEIARFSKGPRITTNFRAVTLVPGGEITYPEVAMLPLQRGAVFFADAGAEAALDAWGSGASFADSSFASADTLYLGRVGAFMAVASRDQEGFAAAFPGEFRGRRLDGAEVDLDALGVIWTLIDSNAGQLSLAAGRTVTYRLGLDPAGAIPPPATTSAWLLDTATGVWDEVGDVPLAAGVYEVEVASLGPVCWAGVQPDECEVRGTVENNRGEPMADANVVYRDLDGRFRRSALTQADGSFQITVPRHDVAVIRAYFSGVTGFADTISTAGACPLDLDAPLRVTLPDYRVALSWDEGHGDLDAYLAIFVPSGANLRRQWTVDHVRQGSLESAPFTAHQGDVREGGPGAAEVIEGRRWYDGRTEYWVHDYATRSSASLLGSGAVVDVVVNDQEFRFPVADVPFDEANGDSSGWWHVFDVEIAGTEVAVQPVQRFQPEPDL